MPRNTTNCYDAILIVPHTGGSNSDAYNLPQAELSNIERK